MSTDALLSLDPTALPDDPGALKALLVEQCAARDTIIAQREQLIERIREEAQQQLEAQRERLDAEHKAAILALLRRYYGPRCETFDPRQLLLFGQVIDQLSRDEAAIEQEAGERVITRRAKNRDEHGRQVLPECLERIKIEHDLKPEEKSCPACGQERHRIGAEVAEQLEYFPASFKVLKHVRHKYACAKCEQDGYNPRIATAPKPPQPIDKGLPGPGLLAYVVTSKLGDHLPLYRLENIFARQRVEVARSTMCAWMMAAGELVQPLVALMIARIKRSRVVHTDDTTVPIQSPGEKQCRKGRIWCYLGDAANPYTAYDYTPNRKRDGPASWLRCFGGYLQADAYGGYDGIYSGGGVTEVACWAHARRKFYDAQDSDGKRAAQMLALIGELYAVEREAKEADDATRLALRQERSVPVLAKIKTWLDTEGEIVLPRSSVMAAITYAQNQWAALNVYVTQSFLNIDNNAAERALKRVAIGRKNWLFAGHDAAAANHARLWSLIASAERHGLDPQRYLTSVLAKLPLLGPDASPADLTHFLPDIWKAEDAAEAQLPRSA
jgi:transposase